MDKAYEALMSCIALSGTLLLMVVLIVLLATFFILKKKKRGQNCLEEIIYTIVFGLVSLVCSISILFPCVSDFVLGNINEVQGIYVAERYIEGRNVSSLNLMQVTIYTEDEVLRLETAPYRGDVFVLGTYDVVAYYGVQSKRLLHIEIIE